VIEFRVLGDIDLRWEGGDQLDSIVIQPKCLALLAWLCLAGRGAPQRRDTLIGVFWPELSEPNARNALSQSLHRIRQALGSEAVRTRGSSEIEIDRSRIECDALAFLDALDSDELEAALDLYRGDLLAGLNVSGSPEFERWLDAERSELRRKAFDAALDLGQAAENEDDQASAARWFRRAAAIIPESGNAVRHLMTVLAGTGNAAEAVREFNRFAARLAEDYDLRPSEETHAVVESIRHSSNARTGALDSQQVQSRIPGDEQSPSAATLSESGQPPGGAAFPASRGAWHVGIPLFLGAATVAAVALVVSGGWPGSGPLQITTSNFRHITNEPGLEFQPAISPDGGEVAYVEGPIGSPHLVVRSAVELGTGDSRPAVVEGEKHWYPSWMPDGASLRFWSCHNRWRVDEDCEWRKVGSRGGAVQTISVPAPGRYGWSRDGTRMAFAYQDTIFVTAADGSEPVAVSVHRWGEEWPHSFAWSPDGERIAFVSGNRLWRHSVNPAHSSIWLVNASGGEPVPVIEENSLNVCPQWLPDGRHLLFVSDRDGARGVYVAEVGPDGALGTPERVPGPVDPHSISVSFDGKRLAYASFPADQNIWSIPLPDSGPISLKRDLPRATAITIGNHVIEHFDISPDGDWIAFNGSIRGEFDLYKQRLAGGEPQLVADVDGNLHGPKWSPDGTEIAFYALNDVFVVGADGGTPERLTDNPRWEERPVWSPDGLSIAYSTFEEGVGFDGWDLWKVTRDRVGASWSDPTELSDDGSIFHDWAPNGRGVLSIRMWDHEMVLVSPDGETLFRRPMPRELWRPFDPVFSDGGRTIYFRATEKKGVNGEDGRQGLWSMPLEGGDATLVVHYDDPALTAYGSAVHDGTYYIAVSDYESDIWVMDLEW
jgi:Tol biopolymer transport system component/DNA-binding SARP family transcriptional activator